jgi:hypothetical protein
MYDNVEKQGRSVVRPTQIATILDPDLYAAFAALAAKNERSVAAELRLAVKQHLQLARKAA